MNALGHAFRNRLLPISLSQAVGVGCGIAGVKIVSQLVPPGIFAAYGIFLTFTTLGVWLVHAGIIKYLIRSWAGEKDRPELLRRVLGEWAKRLLWLAGASILGSAAIAYFSQAALLTTLLTLFVSSALLSLLACMQAILQAERSHWRDFALSATGSLGRSFAAPLLFAFVARETSMLFLGFTLYTLLNTAVGLVLFRKYLGQRPATRSTSALLPAVYLGPLFATLAFATWILYGINRWLVAGRFDDLFAGWFTFAGNMGSLVGAVLGGIFTQFFQPSLYALADGGPGTTASLSKRIDLLALALSVAGVASLLLLWRVSPLLVGTLIAERYRPALEWIFPTGCFALTIITAQFYHIMLLALRRERACGTMDLSTASALILLSVVSVFFGYTPFWWALALSPLVTFFVSRTLTHRLLRTGSPV